MNNKETLIWKSNGNQCNCQSCCKDAAYLNCIKVSSGGFEKPIGSSSSYHTGERRLIINEAHPTHQNRNQKDPMHYWSNMHLKNILNPQISVKHLNDHALTCMSLTLVCTLIQGSISKWLNESHSIHWNSSQNNILHDWISNHLQIIPNPKKDQNGTLICAYHLHCHVLTQWMIPKRKCIMLVNIMFIRKFL